MKKWVKALRSGEYAQGREVLCRAGDKHDYFCCLGVLADIYMQEVGELEIRGGRSKGENYTYNYNPCTLPGPVRDWSGVRFETGDFGESGSLVTLNDSRRYGFKRIADVIEKNWENL